MQTSPKHSPSPYRLAGFSKGSLLGSKLSIIIHVSLIFDWLGNLPIFLRGYFRVLSARGQSLYILIIYRYIKKTPRIAARCPLVVLFNVRSLQSDGISASLQFTARKLPCQALPEVTNRIPETHAVLSSHIPKLFDFWSTRRKSASLPANGSGYPSPFLSKPVDRIPSDRINDLAASFLRELPSPGLCLPAPTCVGFLRLSVPLREGSGMRHGRHFQRSTARRASFGHLRFMDSPKFSSG